MKPGLKWLIIVVVSLAAVYGAFVAFASYSNGRNVTVTFHLGTNADGSMYLRCDAPATATGEPATTAGVCGGGDQPTVTVKQRDRVRVFLVNDDKGDHTHDFNVEGWQYALPPISPEMELHESTQSWTFTTWAPGKFHVLCEISGHDARGMHATLIVQG